MEYGIYIALFIFYRVVRHIIMCLKQILDVMLVLLYVVAVFTLMGK